MLTNKTSYYTLNEYVDIETGEVLTKENALTNYSSIKKTKHVQSYQNLGKETVVITYTNECRPKAKQTNLF